MSERERESGRSNNAKYELLLHTVKIRLALGGFQFQVGQTRTKTKMTN